MARRWTASSIASLPPSARSELLARLSDRDREALWYDWSFWARPNQVPPAGDDWSICLMLAGRGFGKTRAGAEWVRQEIASGAARRVALVGRTASDVRDVIVEGESGILSISPPWDRPLYEPSKRRLTWKNGAIATTYTADKPDQLRGPAHDLAWADELAAWRYRDAWDQLLFGMRLSTVPRVLATTTPRPAPLIKELLKRADTVILRGSSYENRVNLAPSFLNSIIKRYEGTRLGRQELYAEVLDDNPGALWNRDLLDRAYTSDLPPGGFTRIVVGVDPPASSEEGAAEAGIVVCGLTREQQVYVIEDCSMAGTPLDWARQVIAAYHRWKADRVVAETNQGGEMVEAVLRQVDRNVSYRGVRASRGKRVRAEPVVALYEQGRVKHLGAFPQLDDQLCEWVPDVGDSPDRLDALVWAVTELVHISREVQVEPAPF